MKRVRIIKRVLSLLLIFLLSINSFAAIVSDNDGSAFITKAEFDALKSSFQSQIDTYNQSIDSKIDGAIASYLAGIRLTTTGTIKSYVYAINKNGVPFIEGWSLPETRIGLQRKVGGYLTFQMNAVCSLRKSSSNISQSDTNGYYYDVVKQGNYYYGRTSAIEVIKAGLVSYNKDGSIPAIQGSFDDLRITNPDADDPTKVFKINYDNGRPYIEDRCIHELCPVGFLTCGQCGGAPDNIQFPWEMTITSTYPTHAIKGDLPDFGKKGFFGQATGTVTFTWHGLGVGAANEINDYSKDVALAMSANVEDTVTTPAKTENINYFAGGAVPNGKIFYTKSSEWNKPDTSIFHTDDLWTYVWQAYGRTSAGSTGNHGQWVNECYGDRNNPRTRADRKASVYGLPVINTWNYKINNDLYYADLTKFDASSAVGKTVKYYTGVPLCDAIENCRIKVILDFELQDGATIGTFAIKKGEFNNSAIESSDVTLYEANKDVAFNDFNISESSNRKEFEIEAIKGESYWIKVSPSSGKKITVKTGEKFDTIKSD